MYRILLVIVLTQWVSTDHVASAPQSEADRASFFESQIRPVLVANCYECHSAESKKVEGNLLLDSAQGLIRGGESGSAIKAGDANGSLLIESIRYEALEMPPAGKLPDRVVADFEKWVNDGAYDPRDNDDSGPATGISRQVDPADIKAGRHFWSFQVPTIQATPSVKDTTWPLRKIDHFVLSRLEQQGIEPNVAADRRMLIRRVTFDLTGLPPRPAEVDDFLADNRPDAYRRVVERLLASPQLGPRWARVWMDVARYAEDQAHIVGDNQELFYPNAWRYRDWLIDAFNTDMPYDQFVRCQLAADLLGPDGSEHIAALGFLGLGPKYYRRNAPEVMADEWEDRVDTVSRGLIGLTVACARCHDHKYDPIPTEDYYALAGVFASTEMYNQPPAGWKPTGKKKKPDPAITMHVVRDAKPRELKVHIRGDAFNQGKQVPRRFVSVLNDEEIALRSGSGRLPLAEAIVSDNNPLTARVIVNRIWGQYFGRPLVATPSNFGMLGQPPSHPLLLDDLAVRFVESGWSLKWLHREIVFSATYRQSSHVSQASYQSDQDNVFLGRMPRRRLSVEMWRDAILAATNQFDPQIGGTSHDVQKLDEARRTVYSKVSRLELDSMLQLFDYPDPNVHSASRAATTTPLQKLFTLNSPFMVRRAEQLAQRLQLARPDSASRVQYAYKLLFAREPTVEESELAAEFLSLGTNRLTQYAQILLSSNEMLFID